MKQSLFADADETEKDLIFLECLRSMRKEFTDRICQESGCRDDQVLGNLRLEATYDLGEFLYLLAARRFESIEQIEALTQLHNAHIVALTKDAAKMKRLGLARDRLLDAMFTADTLPRLLQTWRDNPGAIDQSNLARLLATVMSTETCRKVVLACATAGFLERERTPYGTIVIRSNGTIERIFGACVRGTRNRFDTGQSEVSSPG
jgi:hypothetical protein